MVIRDHFFSQDKSELDAHPDYWSFGLFNLEGEGFGVDTGKAETSLVPGPIAVYLPRFSVVEWVLKKGAVRWVYLISKTPDPLPATGGPRAFFNVDFDQVFKLITQPSPATVSWLQGQKSHASIGRNAKNHIVAERLKEKIDGQFRVTKTIGEMVEEMGYSPSMASRLFKQKFGMSPVDYRNQLRMKQSAIDLLFKDQTVEATHLSVGIEDPSYFYKCFKRHLNGTPSQFRHHSRS